MRRIIPQKDQATTSYIRWILRYFCFIRGNWMSTSWLSDTVVGCDCRSES